MIIDPQTLNSKDLYKIATGTIVPRPIAWVSTVSENGRPNLAPFSYFTAAGSNPLTLLFSSGHKPDGAKKDTWRNAERSGEFVVNIVDETTAEAMNISATLFEYGESEFDWARLTAAACEVVQAPRVAEAPVAYECSLAQIVEIGGNGVIFGEVQRIHIRDDIYDGNYVDLAALRPVGRLMGSRYCRVTDLFDMERINDPEIVKAQIAAQNGSKPEVG